MRIHALAAIVVLLALALPGVAHAYLDPGAGSLLLQVLAGGVAGGILFVRLFWRRIVSLLRPSRRGNPDPP